MGVNILINDNYSKSSDVAKVTSESVGMWVESELRVRPVGSDSVVGSDIFELSLASKWISGLLELEEIEEVIDVLLDELSDDFIGLEVNRRRLLVPAKKVVVSPKVRKN